MVKVNLFCASLILWCCKIQSVQLMEGLIWILLLLSQSCGIPALLRSEFSRLHGVEASFGMASWILSITTCLFLLFWLGKIVLLVHTPAITCRSHDTWPMAQCRYHLWIISAHSFGYPNGFRCFLVHIFVTWWVTDNVKTCFFKFNHNQISR
jgi:hypothetical protein